MSVFGRDIAGAIVYGRNNKPLKADTIIDKNGILTPNPIYNKAFKRKAEAVENKELIKIAKRIETALKRCGARADELSKAIGESKQAEEEKARQVARADRSSASEYIKAKSLFDKQQEHTLELIKERDEILNREIPLSEYKELIERILSLYEADESERIKELTEHLTRASALFEKEYDQTIAVSKMLQSLLFTLNSTAHDDIRKDIETKHREIVNNEIHLNSDMYHLHCSEKIKRMIDYLNR